MISSKRPGNSLCSDISGYTPVFGLKRLGLLLLLGLLLPFWLPVDAADARPRPRAPRGIQPDTYITSNFSAEGDVGTRVRVSLPHKALIFKRDEGLFRSEIRVTVIVERDGKRIGGGIKTAAATADSYEQTHSNQRLETLQLIDLPDQDPVDLRVITAVVGTQRRWEQSYSFDPGIGSRIPWYFAGFAWNLSGDGSGAFELGEDLEQLEITTTLGYHHVAVLSEVGDIDLVYSVEAQDGKRRDLLRQPLPAATGSDSLVVQGSLPAAELPFGYLHLHLRLVEAQRDSVSLSPPRSLFSFNIPWWDQQAWDRHVSWLEGVGEGDDYKSLKDLPVERRSEAWREFWERSGGDPVRREHLQRILEADRRFSGFGRGALSDRGRILIRHGAPDRIEERDVDMSSAASWKIWYYYKLGYSFVFYDAYGVGDFRLYSTSSL